MEEKINWAEIQPARVIVPSSFLKEQADSFNEQMKDKLVMELTEHIRTPEETLLEDLLAPREMALPELRNEVKLVIIAPALRGYTLQVLRVIWSTAHIYPCFLYNSLEAGAKIECKDDTELKEKVSEILNSQALKSIIANLLVQIYNG